MLIVTVAKGPDKGRVFRLNDQGPHWIGRGGESMPLSDSKMSRHHARLVLHDGGWRLEDLGSKTGTVVDGHRARRALAVRDGSRVRLAESMLVLNIVPEAPMPAPRAAAEPSADQSNQGTDRLSDLIDRIESLIGATQQNRLLGPMNDLADAARRDGHLLPQILDQVRALGEGPRHDDQFDQIAQRLDAIGRSLLDPKLSEQMHRLADAAEQDAKLLPQISQQLQAIAGDDGHAPQLEQLKQQIDAIAQDRLPGELLDGVRQLANDAERDNQLLAKVLHLLQASTTDRTQSTQLERIQHQLDAIAKDPRRDVLLGQLCQLRDAAERDSGLLPDISERLRAMAADDGPAKRIERIEHQLQALTQDGRPDELLTAVRQLMDGAERDRQLLPRVLELLQEQPADDTNGQQLDQIAQRLDAIAQNQRDDELHTQMHRMADAAEHDAELLPRISQQLQAIACDEQHDQQFEQLKQRLDAVAQDQRPDELLAIVRQSAAAAERDKQLLPQVLQLLEASARDDTRAEERRPDQVLDQVGQLVEASGQHQQALSQLTQMLRSFGEENRGSDQTLEQVAQRLDALAQDSGSQQVLEGLQKLSDANDQDGRRFADALDQVRAAIAAESHGGRLDAILERLDALKAGLDTVPQDRPAVPDEITQRLDLILDAVRAHPDAPQADLMPKLFAAVRFLQVQQYRNDQVLLRLLTAADPASAAQIAQARAAAVPQANPQLRRAAGIPAAGMLVIALLCGLIFMVAGIANQTSMLLD